MANWQARAFRVTSSSPRLPVLAPPAVRLPHQRSELRVLKGGEHERQHPVKVAAVPNPGVHDRGRGWIDGGIVPTKLARLQACSFLHLLVELVADRGVGGPAARVQALPRLVGNRDLAWHDRGNESGLGDPMLVGVPTDG